MGKAIDITGQKFGRLTALYPTRKNGRFAWHCKCDCGNECDVDSGNLRTGKQKSCGCLRNENGRGKKKDITGQRFGLLTVLEATEERQSGAIVWRCLCDCGNEIKVPTGNLTSGHTSSCGCKNFISVPRIESLEGKRFGRLVVLNRVIKDKNVYWKCKCDCGNTINVPQDCLRRKNYTQSCGCLKSKGEERIIQLLTKNNIPFETQKTFETCQFPNTGLSARFDFFVNQKYLIEYDGIQHYKILGWNTAENLNLIQNRDKIKNQWCKENNIPLIRIPYTHYEDLCIDDLILERSKFIWQQDEETQQKI